MPQRTFLDIYSTYYCDQLYCAEQRTSDFVLGSLGLTFIPVLPVPLPSRKPMRESFSAH